MSALQSAVEERGRQIFDLVDQHPESLFSRSGFYQRMMEFSMRDEKFKVQMFRFVDVLATLHRPTDIVQHFDEYLSTLENGFASAQDIGVSLSLPDEGRLPPVPVDEGAPRDTREKLADE